MHKNAACKTFMYCNFSWHFCSYVGQQLALAVGQSVCRRFSEGAAQCIVLAAAIKVNTSNITALRDMTFGPDTVSVSIAPVLNL